MSLILHLSDLHLAPIEKDELFGDYKSDILPLTERVARQDLLRQTLKDLSSYLNQEGRELDAIVMTGDITVQNDKRGYEKFEEVLSCLGQLRPAADRICVVPGNHDVLWEVADAAAHYENFITYVRNKGYVTPLLEGIDLKDEPVPDDQLDKHILLGPRSKWAVVPINSAHYCGSLEPIDPIPKDAWEKLCEAVDEEYREEAKAVIRKLRVRDVARISPEQLKSIRDLAKRIETRTASQARPLLIGAIHHQLLPVSIAEEFKPFETITNLGHLRYALRDNRISVILHGHKHKDYVYFDYIYQTTDTDSESPFRVCVVSAPPLKVLTGDEPILRLVEVVDEGCDSTLALTDVPPVHAGTGLRPKPQRFFRVWQAPEDPALKVASINLVEGETVDETYERASALFLPNKTRLSNVICRLGHPPNTPVLPRSYPTLPGVAEGDRLLWLTRIVDWWQKTEFKKLSREYHFNHGMRIFRYDRDLDQLQRAAEVLASDPGTSRAVITLLKPQRDQVQKETKFPSFCFVHCSVRESTDALWLELLAYFRKQEIRFWWPVNVAELGRLQQKLLLAIESYNKPRKELRAGPITTIASTAVIGSEIPDILVPAVDFDFEDNPRKLWDMTYAVCWPGISNRNLHVQTWKDVLANLVPPQSQDPGGALVPIEGVEYLAEISEHFAVHHGGALQKLAGKWRELTETNRAHFNQMISTGPKQPESNERHRAWRIQVLRRLNEIRDIVNEVFETTIPELQ